MSYENWNASELRVHLRYKMEMERKKDDQIEQLERRVIAQQVEIGQLQNQVRSLMVGDPVPLSLDDLAAAWEAAEVPTADAPMRQGDVYISTVERNDRGLGYLVAAAGTRGTHMHFNARILSRAPREPWADLADDLQGTPVLGTTGQLAEALYALGWRKGGDEE